MGTNFYLHRNACPTCGNGEETLHIGKSNGFCVFMFHVEGDLKTGERWLEFLKLETETKNGKIKCEYDENYTFDEFLKFISSPTRVRHRPIHELSYADEKYDYLEGEFS